VCVFERGRASVEELERTGGRENLLKLVDRE
jgi:hypothetical protein